jgi:hypothetical protein
LAWRKATAPYPYIPEQAGIGLPSIPADWKVLRLPQKKKLSRKRYGEENAPQILGVKLAAWGEDSACGLGSDAHS